VGGGHGTTLFAAQTMSPPRWVSSCVVPSSMYPAQVPSSKQAAPLLLVVYCNCTGKKVLFVTPLTCPRCFSSNSVRSFPTHRLPCKLADSLASSHLSLLQLPAWRRARPACRRAQVSPSPPRTPNNSQPVLSTPPPPPSPPATVDTILSPVPQLPRAHTPRRTITTTRALFAPQQAPKTQGKCILHREHAATRGPAHIQFDTRHEAFYSAWRGRLSLATLP
jgi:hypothetical protein